MISMLPIGWGVLISMGLLIARSFLTTDNFYRFLPFNLFLACIPLGLSWLIALYGRQRFRSSFFLFIAGFVWLIFFPNAPYIITDFVHLKMRGGIPLWFDALLILSFASTGLLSGHYSLYIMQTLITRRWGKLAGWVGAVAALALGSFGIYLGRFLRWNSWDLFLDPIRLASDIASRAVSPYLHVRLWIVAGFLLGFLIVSYASVFSFIQNEKRSQK